ncbi:MAG TPA: enterochelin esterase domain-containing protein, partial [Thermoanaerobaculia bacterium]
MRPRFRLPLHVSPIVLALLASMLGQVAFGQGLDLRSPRIHQLWTDLQAGTPNAEANFFASLKDGTPLVEPAPVVPAHPELVQSLVTFLWRGKADTRKVLAQGGRPMDAEIPLVKLPGTQIWYRTDLLPSDARFVYYTSLDADADIPDQSQELRMLNSIAVDPLNPRKVGEGEDATSYVVLPQATPFPYRAKADTPKGRIVDETFTSTVLKDKISLKVYLPAKPVAKGSRPWLLVAFDAGFEDMGTVLDDLIASGT